MLEYLKGMLCLPSAVRLSTIFKDLRNRLANQSIILYLVSESMGRGMKGSISDPDYTIFKNLHHV